MSSSESTAASSALASAISAPQEVSSDAGSVKEHSLKDLIAADQYQASKDAASSKRKGLRITRLVPPGSI